MGLFDGAFVCSSSCPNARDLCGALSQGGRSEPIPWRCERVVWIGWRHGCDGSAGKGFRLLPDELMRCIVRQLRPVGHLKVDLSRSQASV